MQIAYPSLAWKKYRNANGLLDKKLGRHDNPRNIDNENNARFEQPIYDLKWVNFTTKYLILKVKSLI